jgi:hypothetical protein
VDSLRETLDTLNRDHVLPNNITDLIDRYDSTVCLGFDDREYYKLMNRELKQGVLEDLGYAPEEFDGIKFTHTGPKFDPRNLTGGKYSKGLV